MKFIFFLILFSLSSFATTQNFKTSNFDSATREPQYLKFIGSSTKLGLFTTQFVGHAKEFQMNYDLSKKDDRLFIDKLSIEIPSLSLDTDNSSRDEKLHHTCLSTDMYKTIKAELLEKVELTEIKNQKRSLQLHVRGHSTNIPALYSILKTSTGFEIHFSTEFSIKETGIPDPSIAIAKVHDIIKIEGKILLDPPSSSH